MAALLCLTLAQLQNNSSNIIYIKKQNTLNIKYLNIFQIVTKRN